MNALVVYDSQYGNTERIAQAIADTLRTFGQAQAIRAEPEHRVSITGVDLLVVGCPTQGWRPTQPILSFLDGLSPDRVHGVSIACFDTRFRKPRWLTGSAAGVIAKILQKAGINLCVPPESFFVLGTEGPLYSGELERARTWAQALAQSVAEPHLAVQR